MVAARPCGPAVTAREEMLARIRAANAASNRDGPAADAGPVERRYRLRGDLDRAALLDLFAERLADYRAMVRRTTADRVADEIAAALARRGARRVVIPAGLGLPWPGPCPRARSSSWSARRWRSCPRSGR